MTSPSPPPFLACLACGRVTPLPPQLSTQAVLRCPHCHTQFALRDLLVEPATTWELVADDTQGETVQSAQDLVRVVSDSRSDARTTAQELEADYTYVDPAAELVAPVSPGARTVEMPSHQTFVESWDDDSADDSADDSQEVLYEPVAEILFDSNRAANDLALTQQLDEPSQERIEPSVEPPRRKLEGTLVGDFPEERPKSKRTNPISAESDGQFNAAETAQMTVGQSAVEQSSRGQLPGKRSSASRRSRERRTSPKTPTRSPIWSVLQIALGGMAAIPISFLLMWHLLGTDVGDAAPWVAKYAPWIVPAEFHPYASARAPSGTSYDSVPNAEQAGSSLESPVAELARPDANPEELPDEFPTVEPRALSEPETSLKTEPVERGITAVYSEAKPTIGEAELRNVLPDAPSTEDVVTEVAAVGPEPTALENCFALIRQTQERLEEWPQAVDALQNDSASRLQLAKLTYGELTSLAMAMAMAIDELPDSGVVLRAVREPLYRIGQQVEKEPQVRRLIDDGSSFWVRQQRKSEAGTLKDEPANQTVAAESEGVAANAETTAAADMAYGLAMTVVLDSVMQSADGQWWLATSSTLNKKLGEPPLELRIPRDLTISLPNDGLIEGQSLFLLGTVRQLPEMVVSGSLIAPQAQVFVASYLYPL